MSEAKYCMVCSKKIEPDIWPKYIYSPEGEEPLCFDCWEIEYERQREDNEYQCEDQEDN